MAIDISIVINARVNSTRVPKKLIRDFCGTTLLDFILEKVKAIDVPKYVATCEEEIISIVKRHNGFSILDRESLSVQKGFRHQSITFAHYKNVPTDKIMCINPCCPFVDRLTYEIAMEKMLSEKCITLTTVKKLNTVCFDSQFKPVNAALQVSTLNNDPIYEMSHLFHIFDKKFFLENGYFWDYSKKHPFLFEVTDDQSLDIDYIMDFNVCEIIWGMRGHDEA